MYSFAAPAVSQSAAIPYSELGSVRTRHVVESVNVKLLLSTPLLAQFARRVTPAQSR